MDPASIGSIILSSVASKVVSSVLSDEKPAQQQALPAPTPIAAPPEVVAPVEMPAATKTDETRRNAQRMSIAQQLRRRGRQSTMLTDTALTSDTALGG